MYGLARKLLFALAPERAHDVALASIRRAERLGLSRLLATSVPHNPQTVMGLDFPNPIGLAAGLDKNADYLDGLGALGFGFVEVGTVTPRPQPGNPQPRLFRLPNQHALINRLGFNNKGVDHLVNNLRQRKYAGVLGVNIGKNKDTPNENAVADYRHCLKHVYVYADYVTVNVSSPNTPGLRDLQQAESLRTLLETLLADREVLADEHGRHVPLTVKLAPDMNAQNLTDTVEVINQLDIAAVVATNTTLERSGVEQERDAHQAGGLSGAPLRPLADATLRDLRAGLRADIAVIGVGGITEGRHARDKQALGADLVQIYTGFIYAGPTLIADAARAWKSRDASEEH